MTDRNPTSTTNDEGATFYINGSMVTGSKVPLDQRSVLDENIRKSIETMEQLEALFVLADAKIYNPDGTAWTMDVLAFPLRAVTGYSFGKTRLVEHAGPEESS